jgi:hypothetical protein
MLLPTMAGGLVWGWTGLSVDIELGMTLRRSQVLGHGVASGD